MFYVLENPSPSRAQAITLTSPLADDPATGEEYAALQGEFGEDDIDVVDDALLNTAPHNAIERQLLTGDMVGLALMSGAILWSAMGAFG